MVTVIALLGALEKDYMEACNIKLNKLLVLKKNG